MLSGIRTAGHGGEPLLWERCETEARAAKIAPFHRTAVGSWTRWSDYVMDLGWAKSVHSRVAKPRKGLDIRI